MPRLLALFVAACALWIGAGPAGAEDCKMTLLASLPARLGPEGALVVDVQIDGETRSMIFGANVLSTIFTREYADAHGMQHVYLRDWPDPVTGEVYNDGAKYNEMKIGLIAGHQGVVAITKRTFPPDDHIVGILSRELFKDFDTEYDLSGGKFRIFKREHCTTKAVYWADSWFELPAVINGPSWDAIALDATLDGKSIRAAIDPAYGMTQIQETVAETVFGVSATDPGTEVVTRQIATGARPLRSFPHTFAALSLASVTIRNLKMNVREYSRGLSFKGRLAEVVIGTDILSRLRLYVSHQDQKIYFTAATPAPTAGTDHP